MRDTIEEETMNETSVSQMHAGEGDGADFVFTFNGRLIPVSIFPSNGSSTQNSHHLKPGHRPLQDHLIDPIARLTVCEDDGEYDELVEQVLGIILDAGKPRFSQLEPSQAAFTIDHPSLHDLLFSKILYFHLKASGTAQTSITPIEPSEAYTALTIDPELDEAFDDELDIVSSLPRYTPERIVVTKLFLHGTSFVTAAVQVDERDMFCKSCVRPSGLFGTSEGRELEHLGKILAEISEQREIRVPQLLGYLHHAETNQLLGFLRQWVPGRRLSEVNIATTTVERRQKWISQISETIQCLQEWGLVWGDGKPSNIIIDEQDDAWLIDFRRGYTNGWVDEELVETIEGDKQSLAKITKALSGEDGIVLSP